MRESFAAFKGRATVSPQNADGSRSKSKKSSGIIGRTVSRELMTGCPGLQNEEGKLQSQIPLPRKVQFQGIQPGPPSPFLALTTPSRCQAEGYDGSFGKCLLFDFLILVFSEKARASSNSFLRVAGAERLVSPSCSRQPERQMASRQVWGQPGQHQAPWVGTGKRKVTGTADTVPPKEQVCHPRSASRGSTGHR